MFLGKGWVGWWWSVREDVVWRDPRMRKNKRRRNWGEEAQRGRPKSCRQKKRNRGLDVRFDMFPSFHSVPLVRSQDFVSILEKLINLLYCVFTSVPLFLISQLPCCQLYSHAFPIKANQDSKRKSNQVCGAINTSHVRASNRSRQ